MVVAWPKQIKAGGDLRTQFTHCIDIAPTVLEAVGIPEPKQVDGIEQEPMDGTSFLYTLDDSTGAGAPHGSVLRVRGLPRDLQGRLVGVREARPQALGLLAGDDQAVRPRRLRPRTGRLGAVLPARRLLAGPRRRGRASREARGAQGAVLAGGRTQPGATADWDASRSSSGSSRRCRRSPGSQFNGDVQNVQRGMVPRDRRALLRDRGRPRDPRRRRRGGDRRQRRLHRRVRAVGRRAAQAAPHLLVPWSRDLQAGLD